MLYAGTGWASLLIQAGTATSTRRRGEVNAFNLILVARPHVVVESLTWDAAGRTFGCAGTGWFQHIPEGWSSSTPEAGADEA